MAETEKVLLNEKERGWQEFSNWEIMVYNFRNSPNRIIRCERCGMVQDEAKYWDYQICRGCSDYLYDLR